MKRILIVFAILFGFNFLSACDCLFTSLAENYRDHFIVAEVTILNIYGNNTSERTYKADIKFDKIFKGVPNNNTLTVRGLTGIPLEDFRGDACELGLKKGEKYLIFLKNTDDAISSCTPHYILDEESSTKSKITSAENLFSFLGQKPTENSEFVPYIEKNKNGKSSLSRLKNFNPKNNFAVYELLLNSDKKVTTVHIISGFGDHDNEITNLIKKNFWIHPLKTSGTKIRIAFVYIPEYVKIKYLDHISSDLY